MLKKLIKKKPQDSVKIHAVNSTINLINIRKD